MGADASTRARASASSFKRAEKSRTSVELHDAGFHGYRVDCKVCGTVAELKSACPLCGAQGPLRERPDDG